MGRALDDDGRFVECEEELEKYERKEVRK